MTIQNTRMHKGHIGFLTIQDLSFFLTCYPASWLARKRFPSSRHSKSEGCFPVLTTVKVIIKIYLCLPIQVLKDQSIWGVMFKCLVIFLHLALPSTIMMFLDLCKPLSGTCHFPRLLLQMGAMFGLIPIRGEEDPVLQPIEDLNEPSTLCNA